MEPTDYLQVPYGAPLLILMYKIWMIPWCPDHLRPPDSFLEFHEPLLVLITFHEDTSHLNSGKSLSLSHRYIFLMNKNITMTTVFLFHVTYMQSAVTQQHILQICISSEIYLTNCWVEMFKQVSVSWCNEII